MARDRVIVGSSKSSNMEDVVDAHICWEREPIRMRAYGLEDLEWAEALMVELGGRALGTDVAVVKPDKVSLLE